MKLNGENIFLLKEKNRRISCDFAHLETDIQKKILKRELLVKK